MRLQLPDWKEVPGRPRMDFDFARQCLLGFDLKGMTARPNLPFTISMRRGVVTTLRANRFPMMRAGRPSGGDGGARRDRTDDLMLAKHALYQLSYGPVRSQRSDVRSASQEW